MQRRRDKTSLYTLSKFSTQAVQTAVGLAQIPARGTCSTPAQLPRDYAPECSLMADGGVPAPQLLPNVIEALQPSDGDLCCRFIQPILLIQPQD